MALVVLATSSGADAQESDESRAQAHFRTGASYYEAGEYADALREFERAYALSHRADLFYNLSLCHEHLGDIEQAASFLERYLAEGTDVQNRPNLEIRLGHFRERIAAAATSAQQTAAERERAERERAEREAAAATTSASAEPNAGAIASFTVAAVAVIGVAVFAPLAFVEDASLASGCGSTRACSQSDLDTLRAFTITTDVALSVALAGAALGTVLLLVGGSGGSASSERAAIRALPFAAPGSAGVVIGGSL